MTTETLFLIAHVVRGKPAFDVAIQGEDREGNVCWFLATCNHQVYPYWHHELMQLVLPWTDGEFLTTPTPPEGHRDFHRSWLNNWSADYGAFLDDKRDARIGAAPRSILEDLGLLKPIEPFVRRF